jgi:predicted dehydrogenase
MNARRAREIVDIAKAGGAPLMSASSLRYIPDILGLAEEAKSFGNIPLIISSCGNELIYYGIHALETAYAVAGSGAVSCLNIGQDGRNVVRVRCEGGRDVLLVVGEPTHMQVGWQVIVYGERGFRSVQPDLTDLYLYLLQEFLDMLASGASCAVPLDEIVEVIAVLEAGKRSLAEGREVMVAEVLG